MTASPRPVAACGQAVALELRGVRKRYGRTEVIRGTDLRVRAGERLALIGPNGAGKSTLFDLISGRRAPDEGRILLGGRRIDGLAPQRIHRLGVARSFQVSSLFHSLSPLDNLRCALLWPTGQGLAFWRRLAGLRALTARADELLERLDLAGRRDVPVGQLAYAEQRTLEIAMAVAGPARVVLLDEPTAGMSQSQTARVIPLIRELTQGRTLLVVEHDMGVVAGLADRVAVLVQGEVLACDTLAAVRRDARVQAAYLGDETLALAAVRDAARREAGDAAG